MVVHGGINGFSRLLEYLNRSTNNNAQTVLRLFDNDVQCYRLLPRVRSDRGVEIYEVGRYMLERWGLDWSSMIVGLSVHIIKELRDYGEMCFKLFFKHFIDYFII